MMTIPTTILAQRLIPYFKTRDRMIMAMASCPMIAPANISWGMDVPMLAAVLATSSVAPGMFSERMSAFSMLIMTTIHRPESTTLVSIFFLGVGLVFIFSPFSNDLGEFRWFQVDWPRSMAAPDHALFLAGHAVQPGRLTGR